ncbi:hypothetical protein N9W21_06445 [Shewanella sp.]|nr:hypothetical protein [Shewanella sp.]
MTFRRSIDQQWSKSILAHRLALTLSKCEAVQQLFNGATTLSTVTNTIAALAFTEGSPIWLPKLESTDQTPLSETLTLHCLFAASRLLFVKALEQTDLSQSERLVLTTALHWSEALVKSAVFESLTQDSKQQCQLLQTINNQLDNAQLEKRRAHRNMGKNNR